MLFDKFQKKLLVRQILKLQIFFLYYKIIFKLYWNLGRFRNLNFFNLSFLLKTVNSLIKIIIRNLLIKIIVYFFIQKLTINWIRLFLHILKISLKQIIFVILLKSLFYKIYISYWISVMILIFFVSAKI